MDGQFTINLHHELVSDKADLTLLSTSSELLATLVVVVISCSRSFCKILVATIVPFLLVIIGIVVFLLIIATIVVLALVPSLSVVVTSLRVMMSALVVITLVVVVVVVVLVISSFHLKMK